MFVFYHLSSLNYFSPFVESRIKKNPINGNQLSRWNGLVPLKYGRYKCPSYTVIIGFLCDLVQRPWLYCVILNI
jgi:hypothetical protein